MKNKELRAYDDVSESYVIFTSSSVKAHLLGKP